ncbi:MAG: precorrin-3B C(17)-methyltransferase [Desulfamplus sp.]|nr:precorrin-3B C(17)-methyltransferase [Desulfamplus sp.]
MSKRAVDLIRASGYVAGYTTYIQLIQELILDKKVIATGMMKEVERVEAAISQAAAGETCALVSGGDAGIYAMAGLVFELCREKGIKLIRHSMPLEEESAGSHQGYPGENAIEIEVVPGIPALSAAASLLGAPLTHDFAVISLSDLLTPWDSIEKRLDAAAMADFVIAIYNPKSKKRDWQLTKAIDIILRHRSPATPVGIVTSAMREEESIMITTLGRMDNADVGMQTIILVGNSTSIHHLDFMFTPRGYSKKYDLKSQEKSQEKIEPIEYGIK